MSDIAFFDFFFFLINQTASLDLSSHVPQRCTRRDSQDFVINSDTATDQQPRNRLIPHARLFFPRFFLQTELTVCRISIQHAALAFTSQHLFPEPGVQFLTYSLMLLFQPKAELALVKLL